MAETSTLPLQWTDSGPDGPEQEPEPDASAIIAMRYLSLRDQVPALYPISALCVVVACLAAGPRASAWPYAIIPALYCAVIVLRTISWLRSPADAPLALMAATVARSSRMTCLLGIAFALWTAWLVHDVPGTEAATIVLVIFMAEAFAACAMQSTPAAWRTVLGTGLLPLALVLASTGTPLDLALAANLLLLTLFIARNLGRQSVALAALVYARECASKERERALAAEALAHGMAYRDALTGLPNRRALMDDLAAVTTRPGGAPFALLIVDLDGFKRVNDTVGHLAGDRLLQEIGDRLATLSEASVHAYRLGGDEFAFLTSGPNAAETANALAVTIARIIAAPVTIDGALHQVGASVGVSIYPHDDVTIAGLLRRADAAMYRAKAASRGGGAAHRAAA